ncbi:ArsR family transcriptional regulator [Mucilaginibacter sp. HMF5004]|uniref:ArsR/SmtB family transcription factor n=1 Tax=Mucilaginibacter rivuli TaxID=2857527 RepID=UPI001C5FD9B9|nr:helix-turn-helix transcriptional regulator [Mucilaginibacter rivuli]MBW4891052.1 ArsR family transcriptional regulator [Mucilaginibacter rivuli]
MKHLSMDFNEIKITETDNELSNFARAIAIPIRVSIIRAILLNGPWVSPDVFVNLGLNPVTRERHLKSMVFSGIVKEKHHNRKTYYSIDEQGFFKLVNEFDDLFSYFKTHWVKPE